MMILVTHAIYIIIVLLHYIQDCHVQKVTVHAGVLLSDTTALSSPRSPDVVLGERVLRMLISCPVCHRIPLTRSVFMFGTIEDTPSIIRTRCKKPLAITFKSVSLSFAVFVCTIIEVHVARNIRNTKSGNMTSFSRNISYFQIGQKDPGVRSKRNFVGMPHPLQIFYGNLSYIGNKGQTRHRVDFGTNVIS